MLPNSRYVTKRSFNVLLNKKQSEETKFTTTKRVISMPTRRRQLLEKTLYL